MGGQPVVAVVVSTLALLSLVSGSPGVLPSAGGRQQSPTSAKLHLAVTLGRVNVVSTLIDEGVDVNAVDSAGNAPLHVACKLGHGSIVRQIVASGRAHLSVKNADGQTPFGIALANYNSVFLSLDTDRDLLGIIRALVHAAAPSADERRSVFDWEGSVGFEWQRRLALIRTVATAEDLFTAIQDANADLVEAICADTARWANWTDPTSGNPPFQAALATLAMDFDVLDRDVLACTNLDIDVDRYSRLMTISRYFARHPFSDVGRVVADGSSRRPPVHIAAMFGTPGLLGDLLDRRPAAVNVVHNGRTALDMCALMAYFLFYADAVHDDDAFLGQLHANRDLLVQAPGADLWASDPPLAFVLSTSLNVTTTYLQQARNVTRLLGARFALISAADDAVAGDVTGWTALLAAAESGYEDIAAALIDAGADVTVAGRIAPREYETHVLHAAVYNGLSLGFIDRLVSHPDVDVDVALGDGTTPLRVALEVIGSTSDDPDHDLRVIDLLLARGARLCAPDGTPYVAMLNDASPLFDDLARRLVRGCPI